MENRKSLKSIIRISLISALFIFIVLYAHSRTAFLSQGVSLSVENLENGQTIHTRTLTLEGTAKRAIMLTINNRELLIDEEGKFKDILVLHPGLNILTIEAEDRFNNYKELTYTVWHETESNTENTLERYKTNHNSNTVAETLEENTQAFDTIEENTETQETTIINED